MDIQGKGGHLSYTDCDDEERLFLKWLKEEEMEGLGGIIWPYFWKNRESSGDKAARHDGRRSQGKRTKCQV